MKITGNYDAEIGTFSDHRLQCKGGGSSSTTTAPSPGQEKILKKQLGLANQLEAGGELQFFPGQTLAGQSQNTLQGQQQQLGAAGTLEGLNSDVLGAAQRGLNADLVNDPRTEAAAQAAVRPLQEQFFEQTIPGIGSAAQRQGAFGGDRQAIIEGQAARDFTNTAGDMRAQIFADAQRSGQQQQLAVLGQLPQVQQGILTPGQAVQDVGNQEQARSQAEIDADRERFEFGQLAQTDFVNRVNAPLSGINLGQTTTSKSGGK